MNFEPTTYLFDIGNVIIRFDFQTAVKKVALRCAIAPEEILPRLQPLTDRFEIGELTTPDFVAQATAATGFSGTSDEFIAAFEDIFTLNEPMATFIEELSATRVPLYLLSNTNAIHVPYFTKKYPVFRHFEGGIYSHEAGCMKPDPKIYQIAIEKLRLDPEATIYIDDLPANCEAGRAAGLHSICYDFKNHEGFLREAGLG